MVVVLMVLALLCVTAYNLGLLRRPRFIQNFEEKEYGQVRPFWEPVSVNDGLAVYSVGHGEPVLLFPYPHAHTTAPMARNSKMTSVYRSRRLASRRKPRCASATITGTTNR